MKIFLSKSTFLLLVILILTSCVYSEANKCRPSGRIKGKKAPHARTMKLLLFTPKPTSLLTVFKKVEMG
jgi:hypothetical protein